jgi:hypothetical protein
MRALLLISCLGFAASALPAQPAGVPPEWETRKLLDSIVANAKKIAPVVNEINPAAWIEQGAPDTYQAQWRSVLNAVAGLQVVSAQLSKDPTRLSVTLDALFRLDSLNIYLGSLASGVRRYQNPALADLLLAIADENAANRENLRQYALDLATSKEGELKVMESEAQRCLGIIVKQPPAIKKPPSPPRKN